MFGPEVHRLDERLVALAFVGLGEADDGTAEWRERAAFVVSMLSTKPCRRDEKRTCLGHVLVRGLHRGVQEPYPHL